MTGARRCVPCGISWPAEPAARIEPPLDPGYETCPLCMLPTVFRRHLYPIGANTARRLKLSVEFERYCENRPAQPVESLAA